MVRTKKVSNRIPTRNHETALDDGADAGEQEPAHRGGVITAAGLIFAASMCGLLFSSVGTVIQGGFVIGVGILLDTFLVRTITVPAIAALVGRANWWPSRVSRNRVSAHR